MADAIFEDPRLASIYDALDGDRTDLDVYSDLVDELGATSILDVGCGTGSFACLLAARGMAVVGVDPAAASIGVARQKPDADRVRWVVGDATTLPPLQVELATMTGNVAQVFVDDEDWLASLRGVRSALVPGGSFVFEVRDPERESWTEWNREQSFRRTEIREIGIVRSWIDVTSVALPLVSFRWTFVFEADDLQLVSDSTLHFRSPAELESSLSEAGFTIREIRDAPDRPGRELVFIADTPLVG